MARSNNVWPTDDYSFGSDWRANGWKDSYASAAFMQNRTSAGLRLTKFDTNAAHALEDALPRLPMSSSNAASGTPLMDDLPFSAQSLSDEQRTVLLELEALEISAGGDSAGHRMELHTQERTAAPLHGEEL